MMGVATVFATAATFAFAHYKASILRTRNGQAAVALNAAYAAEQTLHDETGHYSLRMADLASVSTTLMGLMAVTASHENTGAQPARDSAASAQGTRIELTASRHLPAVEIEVWESDASPVPTVERALPVARDAVPR